MITISACLIVKNEERHLKRCLDCLDGLMDEIIIVDTGSTDNTKEIAKAYTEKVYDFEWIDDFAAARNFAISKASKEYIYVADADEVLDQENYQRFAQLKQVLLPEIEIVQMKYGNQLEHNTVYNFDEEYRPKLFKRVRNFCYIDPIHETLQVDPVIYDSEIVITHKPHDNHAKRDFASFQRVIARGERLGKRILNMYAKELFIAGEREDFLMAAPYFANVLKEENRSQEEVVDCLCVLMREARIRHNTVGFFTHAMKLMATSPCSELCCELGEFYIEKQQYEEAALWFYNAMHESEAILNLEYQKKIPERRLEYCQSIVF